MKCPKCNSDNTDTARFCSNCATSLTGAEEAQPLPTQTIETPRKELTTGSTFAGRYQIIEELGKGGMGKVYKAVDTRINEKIALKLIKPEIASDKKTLERFGNELKLARKITHKNIGKMFDINEEQGTHYITMEYVSGQDLKGLIRQSAPLSISRTMFISKQICEGLTEAHRQGVVHRDLKPSNIMIDKDGNARIMDFGIARTLKGKGITGAGVIIGTPEYMSPEQVDGKEVDQRTDVYSLGVILYEMLTGRLPFEGETPLSVAVQHRSDTPDDPKEFNPQIPNELSHLILKCLEKSDENRYQSTEAIRYELVQIEQGIPTTERIATKAKPQTSKEITVKLNVRRVLLPTVVILSIIIIAILIWLFILPTSSAISSVAVLPFDDLSPGKNQGHWAEGIPVTLINALNKIEGLYIPGSTSSFSLKEEQDIKKIGEILGVDALLEGSIQVSGSELRILVRLVRIDNGFQIWSEQYQEPVDDVFTIQDQIAQSIVRALKVKIMGDKEEPLVKTSTENVEAYNLYLQGEFYRRRADEAGYYRAIELYQKAIQIDQNFALAYAGLAQSFTQLALFAVQPPEDLMVNAERAAEEALRLDESLAKAHYAYGRILAYFQWDWEKAEKEYRLALQLSPESEGYRLAYSGYLSFLGRYEEASIQIEKALEIDPLSLGAARSLWANRANLGQHEEALRYLLNLMEIDSKSSSHHWSLAHIYIEMEEFKKAIQTFQEQIKLMEGENICDEIGMLAYSYARWGKIEEAEEYLQQLISYSEQNYVSPLTFAWVYGALENHDEAFKWIDKAYEQHFFRHFSPYGVRYDPIRNDPRFTDLLIKMGLEN